MANCEDFLEGKKVQISRGRLFVNLEDFFRRESKEQISRGRLFVSLKDFFRREKRPNFLVDVIRQFKDFWGNRKKPTFGQYKDFKDREVLQCGSDAGLDLDQR